MSEPTDYHRKLAEAIDKASVENAWGEGKSQPRETVIAAVLASEGVVDPEVTRQLQQGLQNMQQMRDAEHAEVERLEVDRESAYSTGKAFAKEQAAKIAEDHIKADAYAEIPYAIRAWKEKTS